MRQLILKMSVSVDGFVAGPNGESIPVVFVDGVQVDFWRVSEPRLRAALGRR